MIALVLAALNDLTRELVRAYPLAIPEPITYAEGSGQGNVRGSLPAITVPEPPPAPGLITCPKCGTPQQPMHGRFAVHFPNVTSMRPCAASWRLP